MGLIRKTMSVSTMGMVSYRTDAQRQRKHNRVVRRHARITSAATVSGAHFQRQQVQLMQQQMQQQYQPGSPAGWYVDPHDQRFVRWWDGMQFTPHVQPR